MSGSAPGWGFVFGLQPDININNENNFLRKAATNGWISSDRFQNQQVLQNSNQTYDADIEIEPWKDFKIDVNFRKSFNINHAEDFINTSTDPLLPNYEQLALRDIGGFEVTYSALNTLFNDDIDGLFRNFENNRIAISSRLPNDGSNQSHDVDQGFSRGYGRQQVEVLVPAFIAAYTGQDPSAVALDLVDDVSRRSYFPKPNWNLTYNGLSKLPWFKDILSSFSLKHGYKSTLSVSRFSTDLQYKNQDPFFIDPDISTRNYFARFEIPEVLINEAFQPLLGIDFKTVNDLNVNLEYAKSRSLQLSTGLGQVNESRSTEYTVGLGWSFENVNIGFLTGGRKKRSSRRRTNPDPNADGTEDPNPAPAPGPGVNNDAHKLVFAFNLQLRDDVTYIIELDDGATKEPTRGLKSLRLNPTIDYDINKNFTLRFFVEYSKTQPYLSTSFPITNIQGGLTARFNLN
jgi:cell surface protein SprA